MNRFIFILFIFSYFSLQSQVSIDTIKIVAYNFYTKKASAFDLYSKQTYKIKEIIQIGLNSQSPDYFIINMEPKGFIIISNSYSSVPVLAYSFESNYNKNKYNPAFDWWMKQRAKEIKNINTLKLPANHLWTDYMNINNIKTNKIVAPLLITKWDQGKYYNSYCPADANGPDGRCLTGCVATAVSQIMYYHRWPLSGTGCHSYFHQQYGTIGACFDTCYYDYNEMTQTLSNYNHSAALLLYTTGVSFDMDYGPNGSGVWNHSVANSMKAYFKYCPQTRYIFRDSTSLNWDSLIITNLNARKPLYYAGWEDDTYTSGHAFVCDGYQDIGYYHFNWGWGGYADGYFYTNQLNPGGANFNFCQELIVDIYPDTLNYTYPLHCYNDTITHSSGTISTNNGSKPYLPNSTCLWLLKPSCGKTLQLQFNTFNLAQGDTLFIFNGENEQSPLLQYFTNSNPPTLLNQPGATTLKSTDNKLLVKFKTDQQNEGYGFNAYFKTIYCGIDTLTASSGIINDGSNNCDYLNYTNCRWVIKPNNAQAIKIEFTQFNLASNNSGDYITIYKNSISSSNQIIQLNAFNPPTQPIYVPSGTAIIRFITNSSETSNGWEAHYEDITYIQQSSYNDNSIIVYPNPINENSFISGLQAFSSLTLYDIRGCYITHKNTTASEITFKQLCPHLNKGIYILKINNTNIKLINLQDF